jgi:hypothetical protein
VYCVQPVYEACYPPGMDMGGGQRNNIYSRLQGPGPHVSPVTSVYNNNTYQPRLDFFLSRFPIDVLAGVPRKRIQILSMF